MKNIIKYIIALTTVLLLTGAAAPTYFYNTNNFANKADNQSGSEYHKTFDVSSGGEIKIDLQTGGEIEVEGWNNDEVEVYLSIDGYSASNIDVNIENSGNDVVVESFNSDNSGDWNVQVSLKVKVPKEYDITFETMGGQVSLSNLKGEFSGTTMGGSLSFKELDGEMSIKTMGGNIDIKSCKLDGKVSTMGGDIDMDGLTGNLDASTMGGDITQTNVKSKDDSGKPYRVNSMGGDIDVDVALNGADVQTMGGDIDVNEVKKFLYAKTMGGNIKVKKASGKIEAETMGGDVSVFIIDDEDEYDDINISSMGGEIELVVPGDFSMDVEVRIKTRESKVNRYAVINDFDIETTVEDNDEGGWFDGRESKMIHAVAKVNGGKHKVTIFTVEGNVRITKK